MVPIYAFTSWLGLTYPQVALYFDFIRECYEAFVIYCFFQLLVQSLGGEEKLAYRLAGKEEHPAPPNALLLPAPHGRWSSGT